MYNTSLKRKWDNKNVMDYAVNTARNEERAKANAALAEAELKAEKEKKDMARQMLADKFPIDQIAKYTKLSIDEINAL